MYFFVKENFWRETSPHKFFSGKFE